MTLLDYSSGDADENALIIHATYQNSFLLTSKRTTHIFISNTQSQGKRVHHPDITMAQSSDEACWLWKSTGIQVAGEPTQAGGPTQGPEDQPMHALCHQTT